MAMIMITIDDMVAVNDDEDGVDDGEHMNKYGTTSCPGDWR